jgi:hypothetical protein
MKSLAIGWVLTTKRMKLPKRKRRRKKPRLNGKRRRAKRRPMASHDLLRRKITGGG